MPEKTRVRIKIQEKDYMLITSEKAEYVEELAEYIDERISGFLEHNETLSVSVATILTAITVTDELFKNNTTLDNLRLQLSDYFDEIKSLRTENEEAQLNIDILKEEINRIQIELSKKEAELVEFRKRSSVKEHK